MCQQLERRRHLPDLLAVAAGGAAAPKSKRPAGAARRRLPPAGRSRRLVLGRARGECLRRRALVVEERPEHAPSTFPATPARAGTARADVGDMAARLAPGRGLPRAAYAYDERDSMRRAFRFLATATVVVLLLLIGVGPVVRRPLRRRVPGLAALLRLPGASPAVPHG